MFIIKIYFSSAVKKYRSTTANRYFYAYYKCLYYSEYVTFMVISA